MDNGWLRGSFLFINCMCDNLAASLGMSTGRTMQSNAEAERLVTERRISDELIQFFGEDQ